MYFFVVRINEISFRLRICLTKYFIVICIAGGVAVSSLTLPVGRFAVWRTRPIPSTLNYGQIGALKQKMWVIGLTVKILRCTKYVSLTLGLPGAAKALICCRVVEDQKCKCEIWSISGHGNKTTSHLPDG